MRKGGLPSDQLQKTNFYADRDKNNDDDMIAGVRLNANLSPGNIGKKKKKKKKRVNA